MYFFIVLLVSYLSFVFASERLNPFDKPRSKPKRRQWRQGVTHAFGVLLAGLVVYLAETSLDLTTAEEIAIFVVVVVVVVVVLWSYRRVRKWLRRS